ncbi:MAG TPA: hypothetical protein PLU72_01265 [Candidatus Ozemobacteraceae bacterium]|nr:hypothetical protein [Candidatus Ozemobacteraceae bacterium]HQG28347.1 hypothetical protein [Candidatus Ozemobacteraceae bacterium]
MNSNSTTRIFSGRWIGGIAVLCAVVLLLVSYERRSARISEPAYVSPLTRIATGPELLEAVRAKSVASDTDMEPLVQRLYSSGWARTAARLARLQPSKRCRVFLRVAMDIGDAELFWANRDPAESPADYWTREINGWYGGERRYRILAGWPPDDASEVRLMQWPLYLLMRPIRQTWDDFFATVGGILPRPFAGLMQLLVPAAEEISLNSVFAAVILSDKDDSPPQIWENIGILNAAGFQWGAVRELALRLPDAWLPQILQLALPESDVEFMLETVIKTDVPATADLFDLVVSMPPDAFARAAGSARRAVLLRHHGIPAMTAIIGSAAARLLDEERLRRINPMDTRYGVNPYVPPPESLARGFGDGR